MQCAQSSIWVIYPNARGLSLIGWWQPKKNPPFHPATSLHSDVLCAPGGILWSSGFNLLGVLIYTQTCLIDFHLNFCFNSPHQICKIKHFAEINDDRVKISVFFSPNFKHHNSNHASLKNLKNSNLLSLSPSKCDTQHLCWPDIFSVQAPHTSSQLILEFTLK